MLLRVLLAALHLHKGVTFYAHLVASFLFSPNRRRPNSLWNMDYLLDLLHPLKLSVCV